MKSFMNGFNRNSISASFFPAVAWPTRVKHTDTNSARLPAAAGSFSQGRIRGILEPHKLKQLGATPSPATIFSRFRNGVVARVLTGTELNAVRLSTMRTSDDVSTGFGLQLPPLPALSGAGLAYGLRPGRFLVASRQAYSITPQPRRNHSTNSRGLRLAWLLGINGGLR